MAELKRPLAWIGGVATLTLLLAAIETANGARPFVAGLAVVAAIWDPEREAAFAKRLGL